MNDTAIQSLLLQARGVEWTTSALALTATILLLLVTYSTRRVPFPESAPPLLVKENLPIVGALRFFTSRGSFLEDGAAMTKTGNFSFYCGKHQVVGLSGLEGRTTFYNSRDLSSHQGYAVLLSAAPDLENADPDDSFATWFSRKLVKLMKRDYFVKLLPHLLNDTVSEFERITVRCGASSGIFNPFEAMNRMVFQLTMRTVGITEIAESQDLLSRSLGLVYEIGENNSRARIIVSWLPTIKYIKRMIAAGRLYMIINGLIRDRKRTGRREDDALQLLLDENESGTKIVEFIVLAILAGQLNSGYNAAWVFCFLALDPHWKHEVRTEVDRAVAKHRTSPEQSPLHILGAMSIDDWEHDFPLTNLCLHESIRIVTVGAGFRKNISGKNVTIGSTGEVIPKGAFAAFHIDQIHMNPDIYTNPTKFDPGRFLPGREEDKKTPLAYAGWGLGRHPCLGMKFAKLEHAVITAVMVAMFDFELCDAQGVPVTKVPDLPRDGLVTGSPGEPLHLKYTQRQSC